jgi:hypothetical protein
VALVNNDGWRDGSDFSLYRNNDGRLLLIPYDVNERFIGSDKWLDRRFAGLPAVTTIKGFADQRRAALLAHPEIVKARQR